MILPCISHNIILHSITRGPSTTHCEEIEMAIEVEDEEEEALEEAEDRWYVTNVNNQDTMKENVHFHLRHVCIVAHQIMTQKTVRHYWGRSRKREIRTIKMFSGFLHKQGRIEEIST
jgi:hypothetical protein